MPVGVRIEVNDQAVRAAFARLKSRGTHLKPVLDEIGAALVSSTDERFQTGTAPDGTPWKPSIRAATEGGKTLIKRGYLRDSITHHTTDSDVLVGTNVLYAAVHQFGTTIKAKTKRGLRFKVGGKWTNKQEVTIPARPFLGISDHDRDEIKAILSDYLREAV